MKDRDALDPTLTASDAAGSALSTGATTGERRAALGRYVVLERLGSGGMGVVYSAYDPELDRKLAVKVLRPELSGAGTRLLREARAMARLSHPNVIAVHDVGTSADGVFVAMELVNGTTLGRWLEEAPRSWREVLPRFVAAGRGLAAAHSVGIVHRDFKPSNVLVDDAGRVRVADFGLARSVDTGDEAPSGAAATSASPAAGDKITHTGAILGTPIYMSPEQLLATPAGAASDQFSFCAALYGALYGERPFAGEDMRTLADEIVHGRLRPAPKESAVPAWIRAALVKGLSYRAEDRFASMDELLAALERDPARVRRRRLVAAGAFFALALGVVGVVGVVHRERAVCRGAAAKLAGVWDDARRKLVEAAFTATGKPLAAESYRNVARALDGYARAWVAARTDACEATRTRREQSEELLDLRMECLDQGLQAVKAEVDLFSAADAKIVDKSAHMAAALPSIGGCSDVAALRAPVRLPADATARTRVTDVRAELARVRALVLASKYDVAKGLAEQAVTSARALHYRPLEGDALLMQGHVQRLLGDASGADKTLADAIVAARAGRDAPTEIDAAAELVASAQEEAHWDAGHYWGRYGQAVFESLGSRDERLLSKLLENMGTLVAEQGKYDEALGYVQHALAIHEKVDGPESMRVAQSSVDLALILGSQGNYKEAETYARRGLRLYEKTLGPANPDVGWSWFQIGYALEGQGRIEEALAAYRKTVDNWEKVVGPDHPRLSLPLSNIGNLLAELGRYDEALVYNRRALAITEKSRGAGHPDAALPHLNIADVLRRQGKLDAALAEFERALAIWQKALGPDHHYIANALTGVGLTQLDRHQPALALPPLERALVIHDKVKAPPADVALTAFALARARWDTGRDRAGARTMATRARTAYAAVGPSAKKELAEVDGWIAAHP